LHHTLLPRIKKFEWTAANTTNRPTTMGSPRSHLKYQWLGIVCLLGFSVLVFARIVAQAGQSGFVWTVAAAALSSALLSDLLSGATHWMCDRYGSETMPVLGPSFIKPFRDHHTDPMGICGHSFVETNGNASIVTLPLIGLGLFLNPSDSLFAVTLILGTTTGLFLTNQFHSWAHAERPPSFALVLQRYRIVLGREHHRRHHSGDFDTNYCITTGWMNPLLEKLKFFKRVESIIKPTVQCSAPAATVGTSRSFHATARHMPTESDDRLHHRARRHQA
jgi:hypothetical protein